MDETVPAGAALLLDFIRETEVGRGDRASYDVIFDHKQHKLAKPLTSMTYGEIVDAQRDWSKDHGSSAAGGYQFMRATLIDLARTNPALRGDQLFEADLQDRLAYQLLIRRGYDLFVAGKMSRSEFGRRLAQEWASFPVLSSTNGAHRKLKRGQSFYAGDGRNKALVAPEKLEAVLDLVKSAALRPADQRELVEERRIAEPRTRPKPVAKSGRFWTWFFSGTGMGAMILENLNIVALDWRVQMLIFGSIIAFAIYAIATMPAVRYALGIK